MADTGRVVVVVVVVVEWWSVLLSGRTKLLVAAGLCLLSRGVSWAATPGSQGYLAPGTVRPGSCISTIDGYLDCTPGTSMVGYYVPGTPGGAARGFEADARVVLVPAVAALLWAARRRTANSVRLAGIMAASLAVISIRAAVDGQTVGAAVGTVAALLVSSARRSPARGDRSAGGGRGLHSRERCS